MTPEQHNKYVGIAHLVYGGFYLLFSSLFMLLFLTMFVSSMPNGNEGAGLPFIVVFWLFFAFFFLAFTIPSFVAGYGLLRHKRWAKTAAIIGGVLAGMSFPVGTAVCVYTFWFLFSEPGRLLYDRPAFPLPPPPPLWSRTVARSRQEPRYVPPTTPPDWR
ncbi:MAG TPA: hypothetical protein VIV66_00075 [Pyrinomonadaceae bacterium]